MQQQKSVTKGDPWVASTTAKWMGVSESEYDALYSISVRTGKCVKPDCTVIRDNKNDLLCPSHRAEYNEWSEQFFHKGEKKQ